MFDSGPDDEDEEEVVPTSSKPHSQNTTALIQECRKHRFDPFSQLEYDYPERETLKDELGNPILKNGKPVLDFPPVSKNLHLQKVEGDYLRRFFQLRIKHHPKWTLAVDENTWASGLALTFEARARIPLLLHLSFQVSLTITS